MIGKSQLLAKHPVFVREGTATLLIITIGIIIVTIGKTFPDIINNTANFYLIWILFCAPILYVIRSITVTMLYLSGCTVWIAYTQSITGQATWYWPVLGIALPRVALELKHRPRAYITRILSIVFGLNLFFAIAFMLEGSDPSLWIILYSSLFSLFILGGLLHKADDGTNPFIIMGGIGVTLSAIGLTYFWPWKDVLDGQHIPSFDSYAWGAIQNYVLTVVLLTLSAVLFIIHVQRNPSVLSVLWSGYWAIVAPVYFACNAGASLDLPIVVFNLYLLIIGVATIARGIGLGNLALINAGMAVLSATAGIRIYASNISSTVFGVMLVFIGLFTLGINILFLLHQRKQRTQES